MANLTDLIVDNFPPVSGLSIPLNTTVSITFDTMMDEDDLQDTVFLAGPDTDQFVGPGLVELQYPDNMSQGGVDDFLKSPGYPGIVEGTFTFETVSGDNITTSGTKVTFTPSKPLAPSTAYTVHVVESLDANGDTVSGHVTWTFESGTGSILALPNTISTSVLAQAFRAPGMARASSNPLSVVKTTPKNHAVQQSQYLEAIDIQFDKEIDPNTITEDMVTVTTYPLTDHPNADAAALGDLFFDLTVSGTHLKIKI